MIDFFLSKFGLTPAVASGVSLWSLAVYLSFSRFNSRLVDLLSQWLTATDRRVLGEATVSRRPKGWEERNQVFASVLSIFPSLLFGLGVYVLTSRSLGNSWAITGGLMVAVGAGVYQLGMKDAERSGPNRRPRE